jgi:hypothetical protein
MLKPRSIPETRGEADPEAEWEEGGSRGGDRTTGRRKGDSRLDFRIGGRPRNPGQWVTLSTTARTLMLSVAVSVA